MSIDTVEIILKDALSNDPQISIEAQRKIAEALSIPLRQSYWTHTSEKENNNDKNK